MANEEQNIWLRIKAAFSGEGMQAAQREIGRLGKAAGALGDIFGSIAGKWGGFMRALSQGSVYAMAANGVRLIYDYLSELKHEAEAAASALAKSRRLRQQT